MEGAYSTGTTHTGCATSWRDWILLWTLRVFQCNYQEGTYSTGTTCTSHATGESAPHYGHLRVFQRNYQNGA